MNDNINKLLKFEILRAEFYLQLTDLFIKSAIDSYYVNSSNEVLTIELDTGTIEITENTKLIQVKRPPNITETFEWCLAVRNSNDEHIGYIGKAL
jgi:hypothetical protein